MLTSADIESVRNQLLGALTPIEVQVWVLREQIARGDNVELTFATASRVQERIRELEAKITETTNYLQDRRRGEQG